MRLINIVAGMLALGASYALSARVPMPGQASPQASQRSYSDNYKDMVLAICLANAYRNDTEAAKDVGSSVSALRDWTYYDMDESPEAINRLVADYLERNYRNPLVESEVKDVKFDFLKCMDLYHSKELEAQVKRFVIKPKHTYRQDNPPTKSER